MSAWSYGGDLDHVHSDHRELQADATDGIEQLAGGQAPGFGGPVPGAEPGSTTSMSTEKKTPSHSSVAMENASVRHSVRPRCTISVIS